MAASYGSVSVVAIANNATVFTIPKPTGLTAGERVAVALLANSGTATYSYTSGGGGSWADASGSPEATVGSAALTKIADAADVAATNFTFTRTAGTTGAAIAFMVRFTGAGTIADVNATSGSGTTLTLAQVTAANADTLLVHLVAKVTNATGAFGTPPNSATLRASGSTSGTVLVYAIADEVVGSGATGTRPWTYTGTSASRGYLLAINPGTTTGSGAATLPSATASGSGSVIDSGSGAATLPSAAGSGAATVTDSGAGAATLPSATASGAGTVTAAGTSGAGAATLPAATGSGSGAVTADGSGAATLPPVTADSAGDITTSGSGAADLPILTADAAGGPEAVTGSGAATLPSLVASGTTVEPRDIDLDGELLGARYAAALDTEPRYAGDLLEPLAADLIEPPLSGALLSARYAGRIEE